MSPLEHKPSAAPCRDCHLLVRPGSAGLSSGDILAHQAAHLLLAVFAEPPRWTKKPQSGVYSTGGSGILLCEAEGDPAPTIKWRVNGLPIESK